MSLRPITMQARAGMAEVLLTQGRIAEAEETRRAVQAMRDEMAALFTDEKLRALSVEKLESSDG